MNKKIIKNLFLSLTMLVLCLSVAVTVGAADVCEHEYERYVDVEPTCDDEGSATWYCMVCNDKYVENLPALGHKINVDNAFAFGDYEAGDDYDCTVGGEIKIECSRCWKRIPQYVEPKSHQMDYWDSVEPTCTENGSVEWGCMHCRNNRYTEIIPALGHNFCGEWTELMVATCYDRGVKIKQCLRCSVIASEIIERTPHTDIDVDGKCDDCSCVFDNSGAITPDDTTPETPIAPEQSKEESSVFSFLTELLNNLFDFLRKIFGIE